jgi:hypothetical protein
MSKHTTGDWRLSGPVETDRGKMWGINGFVNGAINGLAFTTQDCRIAEVFSIEANAKLIVRAPNLIHLLRLLETAARRLAEGKDSSPTYVIKIADKADALIHEIEGE